MNARFRAISGVGSKGPACFLLEAEGARILIDAGVGPDDRALPDLSSVGELDAIALSHAHPDHAGAFRLALELGAPKLYATRTTLELLGVADGTELPMLGAASVVGIPVRTGRTGHCAGGVWIRFDVGGGLLYMGDSSLESTVFDFDTPPPSKAVVIDASYGRYDGRNPTGAALADGLSVPTVFPVPAEGRGVEMAALLLTAGKGPVAIDAPIRASLARCLGADRAWVKPAAMPMLERLYAEALEAEPSRPTGFVFASNGEASEGVAAAFVERYETAESPAFVFTGYTGAGTASERLVRSGRGAKRRWNVHPTFAHNVALVRAVGASRALPAFLETAEYREGSSAFAPASIVARGEELLP